jgi:hypothetical protein
MGVFITRVRPGDRERQELLVEEARCCYSAKVPLSDAVARLVELAGDNPNAFGGTIAGNGLRGHARTPEGQAISGLMSLAESTGRNQARVGVERVVGQRRTPEEAGLASKPVGESFNLLAEQDPRLKKCAQEPVAVTTRF